MSRKTRKLIWSTPLVAVLAVAGALAIFMTLVPTGAEAHDLPGPVSNLQATAVSWSEIRVTWDAPTTGGTATGYRIDVSDDQFVWKSLKANIGNRTSYNDTGLEGGQPRHYRVFALNAAGAGPSPVGEDTSNDLFVSAYTLPAERPGQAQTLSARAVSYSQIDVTWTAPASNEGASISHYCIVVGADRAAITAYATIEADCVTTGADQKTVAAAEDNIAGGAQVVMVASSKTKLEHEDLAEKTTRYYRLYALNSVGVSSTATNVVNATTPERPKAGAPRNLKIVSAGPNIPVNLYWNWPAGALDTALDQFYIQYKSSHTPDWSIPPVQPTTTGVLFPAQATHSVPDTIMNPVTADPNADPPVVGKSAATWIEYRVMVGIDGTPSRGARLNLVPPAVNQGNPSLPLEVGLPGLEAPPATDITSTSELRTIRLDWERKGETGEVLPTGFVIDALKGDTEATPPAQLGFQSLQANTSYSNEYETPTRSEAQRRLVLPRFPLSQR